MSEGTGECIAGAGKALRRSAVDPPRGSLGSVSDDDVLDAS